MDDDQLKARKESWAEHIDSLAAEAISPKEMEAAIEQTSGYFYSKIAGDC